MSTWGGPCVKCGHPASYHGATFCKVQAGAVVKRDCDCHGYADVERLRCAHCGEVGCDWIGDIHKARAEAAEAALGDARAEVERLRAERHELRDQVRRLRASRESNRGGWERTLVERDALRAAVDRVRALGARAGRDRLAAWLASNGVEQPDTVAVEAAAFVLAALEPGNYGTPEWFSSIEKPLFPPSKPDDPHGACSRNLVAVARERDTARAAHAALIADLRALRARSGYVLAADVLALLDRHALTTGDVA